jgi:hypothetical protein
MQYGLKVTGEQTEEYEVERDEYQEGADGHLYCISFVFNAIY